eukprot:jgi/Psemu1/306100/fgenesh1_kg.234_\
MKVQYGLFLAVEVPGVQRCFEMRTTSFLPFNEIWVSKRNNTSIRVLCNAPVDHNTCGIFYNRLLRRARNTISWNFQEVIKDGHNYKYD